MIATAEKISPASELRKFTAVPAPVALVVDDDDRAAEALCRYLATEGYAVVRSMSGEDALLELPGRSLALITLDLQMYSMNGWQFLKKLRESGMQPGVPVIIISSRQIEDGLAESRGVAAVLQKPIGRIQLRAALAKLGLPEVRSRG